MKKKEYHVTKEDIQKTKNNFWYKLSDKFLHINIVLLFSLSVAFAICRGYFDKLRSALYANINSIEASVFMEKLIWFSIASMVALYGINTFAKAARLSSVNEFYLKAFRNALKSKVKDISTVGPERILSATGNIAVMQADIRSRIIDVLRYSIPFIVVIWNVARISIIAAISVFITMTFVIVMNLSFDNLFHFTSIKGKMKSDMQSLCSAQFMVLPMLKYMSAEDWAYDRLDKAQNKATPIMHNSFHQLYNFIIYLLMTIPEFIALYCALFVAHDKMMTVYLSLNIGSVYMMMDLIAIITELISDLSGEKKVMNELKGDDTAYKDKPGFPEKLHLKNIKFYYKSDEDKKKPFIFNDIVIEKGKKYRIVGPSGCGKSSGLRFFAGEMESDYECDFRTLYIHQESKLIRFATLRDNITLGNKWVPDGDIESLLEDVCMGQWLRNLPHGLDSIIGVDVNPSGGESARISLLRGFIHVRNYTEDILHHVRNTSDLIMLDEVTSAIDKRTNDLTPEQLCTEEQVIKVIEREFAECTCLIISHEDETSSAFGMRHIVDYRIKMQVNQNEDKEEHIFYDAVPVKKTAKITANSRNYDEMKNVM
jgi:ABC-type transport system involved in cytochrome bd biosynthesis fused ATPase/permease subunit